MAWLGLGPVSLARRASRGAATPITADALPALGSLAAEETLSVAVSWGSYSSAAGSIITPTTKEMNVNGGAWVAYDGSVTVSAADTHQLRETVFDDAGNSRPFATRAQTVSGVAPSVTASNSLSGRALTIAVDSATGTPAPSAALTALTLDGVDVAGDATGSGPWEYVSPDSETSQTVAWTVTATNFEGSDTASGSTSIPANLAPPAAPIVAASDSLAGRTLTISVDSLSGNPSPSTSLATLTLDGIDVLADVTGSDPWTYAVPSASVAQTVAWTVEATNSEGVDTASGSEAVAANLFAPTADTAPSITGTVAPEEIVTITEGTYSGPPAPSVTGTLTLDGADVTADMTGLDYTIPAGTEGQDLVWTETATNGISPDSSRSVSGTVSATPAVTGGTITDINAGGQDYRVHTFTANGTLEVSGAITVEHLLVAGGGASGAIAGGGGGGGGGGGVLKYVAGETGNGSQLTLTAGTYAVVVGDGGAAGTYPLGVRGTPGTNGGDTTAFGLMAIGGGYGGVTNTATADDGTPGNDGGSGGGGAGAPNTPVVNNVSVGGAGVTGQGFAGGDGLDNGSHRSGGGGGGAATAGLDGAIAGGGDGGDGVESSISGSPSYYGGGGGAGCIFPSHGTPGRGGLGGGGVGSNSGQGVAGADGTGGGAGGSAHQEDGADGGSGIVIIRYQV